MAYINGRRILNTVLVGPEVEACKKTVTDNPAVLDYVHPTEHTLDVRLTSDTMSDFSGVAVKRCGKNLFDPNLFLAANQWSCYTDDDHEVYTGHALYLKNEYHVDCGGFFPDFPFEENTQYTFSCMAWTQRADANDTQQSGIFAFLYTDGTKTEIRLSVNDFFEPYTVTSHAGKTVKCFYFTYKYGKTVSIYNAQFEKSSTATGYERYIGTEHTANADGTVPMVPSVAPTTMLTADTDGVLITAGYYLDAESKIADLEETILTLGGEV